MTSTRRIKQRNSRSNKAIAASAVSLLLSSLSNETVDAFSVNRNIKFHQQQYINNRNRLDLSVGNKRSSRMPKIAKGSMSMYIDDNSLLSITSSPLLYSSSIITSSLTGSIQISPVATRLGTNVASIVADPQVEAELLSDMAHIALDLTAFIGPATAALRLFGVLGRIFALSADFVPDQVITMDELLFQMFMLSISTNLFVKSARPMIQSTNAKITHRDIRSYHALFSPAGMTWQQYKTLVGSGAIDFIQVRAGQVITSDEHDNVLAVGDVEEQQEDSLYWLYSGEAQVQSKDRTIQTVTRKFSAPRLNDSNYMALLGGMRFARRLDENRMNKNNNKKRKQQGSSNIRLTSTTKYKYPQTTIKAGPNQDAMLLRINTDKLESLMENDDQLSQCIRSMLLAEMQETLDALVGMSSSTTTATASISKTSTTVLTL